MATRMAGSDEFKEELSKADRNAAARERMASSEAGIDKRLEGVEGIEGLDRANVVRAMQGGGFGEKDLARYNKLMGIKDEPEIEDGGLEDMPTIISDPYEEPNKPDRPGVMLPSPPVMPGGPGGPGNGGGFYVGGDLTQNVGKTGDMTTNIGDGNTITGSQIGNDNSDTIGGNNAGNSSLSLGTGLNSRLQGKSRAGAFARGLQFS
ncbi:hypothetical protein N8654_02090 [Synechococcus sp. AH-601-B19]|nr:hypothetical protein [Synechococcus sp. AH-601-B19]